MAFSYNLPDPMPRKRAPKEIAESEAFSAEMVEAADVYNLQRRPSVVDAHNEVEAKDLTEFWNHVEAGLEGTRWMLCTNEVLLNEGRSRLLTRRQ